MDTKSKNNFKHYFVESNHTDDDFFQFNFELFGHTFQFTSCDDVFSKNGIDEGSLVLIKTLLKFKENFSGEILDIACGYGAIGIILGRFLENVQIDMCDINNLAIKLCKINSDKNSKNYRKIFASDMWENVTESYDHIVSNPPIKTGKKVLLDFLNGLKEHLKSNGDVTIVIKKNLGADSTKKYLNEIFGNCEVLERERGYYILQSKNK